MRVLSVFGTRPEAVKMAPVVQTLSRTPGVEAHVCVTAQHREMLDQVLDLFDIRPDVDLDLMRPDQSLAELSAAIFTRLDPVLTDLQPDWVLVQGDTTTVAITALLAYYRRMRVGHVEAGLRTHDKWQPFPEEINRRVAGVAADLHFAPTEWARQNLLREGIPDTAIAVTGNTVIDALHIVAGQPSPARVVSLLGDIGVAADAQRAGKRLILVTAHRRENFGRPLEEVCAALRDLARRGDVEIVYPVHRNPNIQEPVRRQLEEVAHVTLLPPLDYLSLVHLMKRATLVLTDSGGIQEEAPTFGVPVLVLREATERPEGVEAGVLKLVGTGRESIVREAFRLLDDETAFARMARAANPFGDGKAAVRIVQKLVQTTGGK
ncbi:MAG: UDP-N-acetylglucosamine 2-epimerase (non-hydrolyzing) [Anaerolineales bacterium]|nr:UDP-N-acetylglucosamine 2-epimerase (non-hydrolyzing) [Anaerolineales bacterium]